MRLWTLAAVAVLAGCGGANAGPKDDLAKAWDKGAKALVAQQMADGSWSFDHKNGDVAATGLAVAALAGGPAEAKKPYQGAIDKGCAYLVANQGAGGEIHNAKSVPKLTNYKTAISIMALAASDREKYKDAIAKAGEWFKHFQYGEDGKGEYKVGPNDPNYGGAGYEEDPGEEGPRADLSNTAYMLEALEAAGVPKDSDVWKRAMKYIEHCQNRSESNDGPGFDKMGVVVGDDGGFFYRPGESKAEKETLPNGKQCLRSYGSMTYSGYKSMIYAGLKKDDPRVKAAYGWLQKHWTVEENPGMKDQGLYYYYNAMSAALDAAGDETIVDADGGKHVWAEELSAKLAKLQKEDGSWSGNPRWYEDMAPVPTCMSMMALGRCAKHLK